MDFLEDNRIGAKERVRETIDEAHPQGDLHGLIYAWEGSAVKSHQKHNRFRK